MILSNRSETVVLAGITPKDYGLLAEFALICTGAPKLLELYKVPIHENSKPMGRYRIDKEVTVSSVFLNLPLEEAKNDS